MNRTELIQYLENPIKHNSMYDNDIIHSRTKVFDHCIGVTYSPKHKRKLRKLQRPGIK